MDRGELRHLWEQLNNHQLSTERTANWMQHRQVPELAAFSDAALREGRPASPRSIDKMPERLQGATVKTVGMAAKNTGRAARTVVEKVWHTMGLIPAAVAVYGKVSASRWS